MGKSPAKWIKTILFGKKSSKSGLSKAKKDVKNGKRAAADASFGDLAVTPPEIIDLPQQTSENNGDKTEFEKAGPTNLPSSATQVSQETAGLNLASNGCATELELAATKAQAAFRGYLARRAFKALKGIIRLQALIRGHLVRRQGIATLRCMCAIVKFQALARGRKVRLSNSGYVVVKKYHSGKSEGAKQVDLFGLKTTSAYEKIANNRFASKLIASVPTAMPLSLQYDPVEPNSAWNWLERWSLSRFWEPLPHPKKLPDSRPRRKQSNVQAVELEPGKTKRVVKKVSTTVNGDNNGFGLSESEKPKRNVRKGSVPHSEPGQDHPQSELERVKRNLRKVSASSMPPSDKSEVETEKLVQNPPNPAKPHASGVPEQQLLDTPEKMENTTTEVDKPAVMADILKTSAVEGQNDVDSFPLEHISLEEDCKPQEKFESKVEVYQTVNEEYVAKDDQDSKENQRMRRRRSLPSKQEYPENVSQNTPSLPSYMAATESAKAKLRAQGSPKISEDGGENGFVRRHSLPSNGNGKLSSLSPRVQKSAGQANGKAGSKSNRSLSSSRDEKVLQPGWRR